jgi:hypothetical protein
MSHWITDENKKTVWKDVSADAIGDAVDVIYDSFLEEFGRKPTKEEILLGVSIHIDIREGKF